MPAGSALCSSCVGGSVTFSDTGREQTFVVPRGVTLLHVVAVGALGGR